MPGANYWRAYYCECLIATILLLAPFPDFSMMIGMLEAIKTWTVVGMTQIPVHT